MKLSQSIKTRLIAVMALLVIIPIAVSTIVSSVITRSEGEETAYELNDLQASLVEASIQSVIDENIQVLESLASSPSTINYIQGDRSELIANELMHQMQEIDQSLADGNSTILTGKDGMQLIRTVGNVLDISDREYFKQGISGKIYVSDIQVSKSTGERITTFVVPVYNFEETEVIGIVQRNYNLEDFHDIIAEEVSEERQEIVIVDTKGDVVAHSGHSISPDENESQAGNPFYTDSRGTKTSGQYEALFGSDTWFISWVKEARSGWVVASCRVKAVALAEARKTMAIMIIIGVVAAIAAVAIAFLMANSFTNPVKEVNVTLEALADGRFVKIDKYTDRKDEFGAIIHNTNSVISKLDTIVSDIKKNSASVNTASDNLASMASQIATTTDDVANSVQAIANGATQQAEEIQSVTESTNAIGAAVAQVIESTDDLADLADNMQKASNESAKSLGDLQTSCNEMKSSISEITEKISATSFAVDEIGKKVEAITNIASQTNLLTLNASIEAARAGDAGRGFAVVAEEIGNLADNSKKLADEISATMNTLLRESQEAVDMAERTKKVNDEQMAVLEQTVVNVDAMMADISSTVGSVAGIRENAGTSESAKNIVVDAMSSLSAISEENAASSEETGASSEELAATVTTLSESADSLKDIANKLSEDMAFFK